jgi:EmrB/QacA subfamily drug resistance transporter
VLAICALSLFLVGLDTTIINVGLPSIGRGLGAGTRSLELVVDAYTVVFASLLISSGALADRFGRRRVFQCGLAVFGAASLASALSPSLGVLVAARAIQGAGASMLSPVALAIVVNAMPDLRERARAIGVWASVFGLSMAAGPVTGGALIAAFGWRSVFWINAPVIAAAVILSALLVPESRAQRARRLDLPGQALLTMAVSVFVGVLIEGPRIGWASPLAWAGYLVAVAAAAGFTLVELRRREPLMDLGLFRRPAFTTAVLGAAAVFAALNVTLLLNTLYLQHARGWTPLAAGLATLPMALGATVCAPLSGNLAGRRGPRMPLLLAGAFTTAGALCLAGRPQAGHQRPAAHAVLPAHRHRIRVRQRPDHQHRSQRPAARPGRRGRRDHLHRTPGRFSHRHRHRRRPGRRRHPRPPRPGNPPRMADRRRLRPVPLHRGASCQPSGVNGHDARSAGIKARPTSWPLRRSRACRPGLAHKATQP